MTCAHKSDAALAQVYAQDVGDFGRIFINVPPITGVFKHMARVPFTRTLFCSVVQFVVLEDARFNDSHLLLL